MEKLPDLIIGDLKINPPVIQGGMGVRISLAKLSSAVANEGAVGIQLCKIHAVIAPNPILLTLLQLKKCHRL